MTQPAKHTPGPLHNVTGHRPGPWIRQVLNDESEAYIHDKHCNAIARVYSLSDAALIAAAPTMYADLCAVRDYLFELYDEGNAKAGEYAASLGITIEQAEGQHHE